MIFYGLCRGVFDLHMYKHVKAEACIHPGWSEFKRFPKQTLFMCLQYKSNENTVGKGEIARIEQFLPFPMCFFLSGNLCAIFIKSEIVVCKKICRLGKG